MKPIAEDDVCRELQHLLTVEPSPSFVARVRTTVANQPVPSSVPSFFIALTASLTAVVLVAVAIHFNDATSDDRVGSSPSRQERTAPAPIPDAVSATSPAAAAPAIRAVRSTDVRDHHISTDPQPQVMIDAEDVRAFEQLLRSTEDGTVALSFEETNLKLTMTELTIAPITTEPLALPEQQGVVQ
jgi:hypothetical protein